MRALFPGRFQPFHLGHLAVIEWLLTKYDEIIVVIGSGKDSHSIYNPFTAGERMVMIRNGLKEYNMDFKRVIFFPILESFTGGLWIRIIEQYSPKFDVIVSGNPLVVTNAKEAGYIVDLPPMFNRDLYNATKIRKLMIENDNKWSELVPKSVYEFIKEIKGDERLRDVAKSDY
ncbi:nicotinamide-nucleotide adenylyltransferase [Sulfurisphaera javensis]|uniref:Nicotinamide-nucleotide adenylyltransferase n=1 Tax=Sulfurisphaera javensis TaxID=2049879 RepID=A0AAT9GSD1_9CREN